MKMTEATKKFMKMSIWAVLVLFALRCLIGWGELSEIKQSADVVKGCYVLFGYAGEAIGVAALFMAVFNKWLWKWKPLNMIAGGMPVLAKQYKGTIRFKREGKEQERDSKISIKQTFLTIIVKVYTAESSSNSVTATIETINNDKQLVYTYLNTPRAELQDQSSIHYGTAMLTIRDSKHLSGNYFTIRLSRGSMDFEAV